MTVMDRHTESFQKRDQTRLDGGFKHLQQCQRHRKLETPWARAPWVEIQGFTTPLNERLVRVAGDHQLYALIKHGWNIGDVMHEQGLPSVQVEPQKVRQMLCPGHVLVVVAAHNEQWSDSGQVLKHLRLTDVAGVNDSFAALQGSQCLGAEKAVGIGDHSNFHAEHRDGLEVVSQCIHRCLASNSSATEPAASTC